MYLYTVDIPSISVSSMKFLDNLVAYYRSTPENVNSDEFSDEVN